MDSLANEEYNSDILCRAKQLSIIRIVFVTGLMIKRQRNGFHAPAPYFYLVTDVIIRINTQSSLV